MLPPAPGRFSITNGCLTTSSILRVRMRASTSLGPPGAKPMISVIGLVGWQAAPAGRLAQHAAAMAAAASILSIVILPRRLVVLRSTRRNDRLGSGRPSSPRMAAGSQDSCHAGPASRAVAASVERAAGPQSNEPGGGHQSSRAPEAFTTADHFGISALI